MGASVGTPAFGDARATWNTRFAREGYVFGTAPNAWLRTQAQRLMPGQRALCVADGEGRNSVFLAERGLVVEAFDIAEAGVEKARRLAARQGVHVDFHVADSDAFDWPEATCDAVVAIFVQFAAPAQREHLFAAMRASLKPGGLLLLLGYGPKQLEYRTGGPGIASHLYTEPLLREAFAGLQLLELRSFEAELDEGEGHRGRSALVGLVARMPAA